MSQTITLKRGTVGLMSVLFVVMTLPVVAQFPAAITLPATGAIVTSPPTNAALRYRITVEGSYSMWPQFVDCHGVDGSYVYDVPQEEIDAYRWPPETIKIGSTTITFVEIPHWVGDDKLWAFPETGTPLFALSFRKYKGFRIDGEPLPNTGLNLVTHRYQTEKMGTGAPFVFSILDSNYNVASQSAFPRYEDNCGSLKITVEEIGATDLNICDLRPVCDATHRYIGALLKVSLFGAGPAGGRTNILRNADPAHFTITADGGATYKLDSISCGRNDQPAAFGLLVDRSGSMAGPISGSDPTVRMTASRNAVNAFIDHLQPGDSAFVASFADMYFINQDWTDSRILLKTAVNTVSPGGQTAFFGSVAEALDKVSKSSNPRRALIVLSDGANTAPPPYSPAFLAYVRQVNIPVYIVALGLSNSAEDIDGRQKMDAIATASRGRVYDVYNASSLDSVYNALGQELGAEDCCAMYFTMPPCVTGTERTFTVTYKPDANPGIARSITIKCDTCSTVSDVEAPAGRGPAPSGLDLAPNPAYDGTTVTYTIDRAGPAVISVITMDGIIVHEERVLHTTIGTHRWSSHNLALRAGSYMIAVQTPGGTKARRLIVVR